MGEDLAACTDTTVMRMVPDAPLSQAHQVFKQLGCQHIFVVGSTPGGESNDALLGMLSKKSFLRFLKDGRVGHMPVEQGSIDGSPAAGRRMTPDLYTAFEAARDRKMSRELETGGVSDISGIHEDQTDEEDSDDHEVFGSGVSRKHPVGLSSSSAAGLRHHETRASSSGGTASVSIRLASPAGSSTRKELAATTSSQV